MRKTVYLASPFFTQKQKDLRDNIMTMLLANGFKVYSPEHQNLITDMSTTDEQQSAFEENLNQIDACDFVLAIGNDYDTGTMIEIGYAFKANKSVIYFNNSNDGKKRNLMLAGASFISFNTKSALRTFLQSFNNCKEYVE